MGSGDTLSGPSGELSSGDATDAHVERPWGAARYHYLEGTRAVIELIIERFVEGGRDLHDADTLIFPLGQLCRHLVELRVKELHELILGIPAQKSHNLLDLWRGVRPAIDNRWPSSNRSSIDLYGHLPREILDRLGIVLRTEGTLDRAEGLIAALDEIDPRGTSFRYPEDLPSHIKSVSLEKIAASALELDDFLDGLSTGVHEERTRE
jgi:hypothetical protein